MKNIRKYFGLTLIALLFSVVFSACEDKNDIGSDNIGLGIKVFSPTKVVTGQPVTINGSGFGDVKEIVFPGNIVVTNFEKVSDEMIRVITPAGINIPEEGEHLTVRTADAEAVSPRVMTQGNTVPHSYSVEEGADVKQKSIVTIYGQDMEFVNRIVFEDKDGNPIELGPADFYRIATSKIDIKVPANAKEGKAVYSYYTYDGKKFDLPEYNYVAGATGHWEINKKYIWQNPDPEGNGAPNWDGKYRFGLDGNDGNNECIATFDAESWDAIKEGEVYFLFDGDGGSNIRITTGWWTGAYGGDEHNSIDFAEDDEETGKKVIKLNFKEEGNLYANIDAQHLLFTGSAYIPLAIYTVEEVWVEDEEGHWERKSLWKNDGTIGAANWDGKYRFGLDGNDGNNECIATFDADTWALIKEGKVLVELDCDDSSNIRITTGWWTGAYGGDEHNSIDFVQTSDDNKKFIELDIKGEGSLYGNIDAQHLLFTGSGYSVSEIYIMEWIVDGAGPKPITIWENEDPEGNGAPNWDGKYRFGLDGNDGNNECIATFDADTWAAIKDGEVYFLFDGDENSNVRITTGWWTGAYGGDEHNSIDFAEDDAASGKKVIKLNFKEEGSLYDNLDAQHLLFTGSSYTPLKLFILK